VNDLEGHRKWRDSMGHISLPLSVGRNNANVPYRLQETVICDLEKSFGFDMAVTTKAATGYDQRSDEGVH